VFTTDLASAILPKPHSKNPLTLGSVKMLTRFYILAYKVMSYLHHSIIHLFHYLMDQIS